MGNIASKEASSTAKNVGNAGENGRFEDFVLGQLCPHFEAIWASTWAEVAPNGPSWGQVTPSAEIGAKWVQVGPDGRFGQCWADMQNLQIITVACTFLQMGPFVPRTFWTSQHPHMVRT